MQDRAQVNTATTCFLSLMEYMERLLHGIREHKAIALCSHILGLHNEATVCKLFQQTFQHNRIVHAGETWRKNPLLFATSYILQLRVKGIVRVNKAHQSS
jgi:hypothetical protein